VSPPQRDGSVRGQGFWLPAPVNRGNPEDAALYDRQAKQGAYCGIMDEDKVTPPDTKKNAGGGGQQAPDWTSGLRQLYNSVVDEPLPDSFAKLLEQLDSASDD
jgi:hypothetical protein